MKKLPSLIVLLSVGMPALLNSGLSKNLIIKKTYKKNVFSKKTITFNKKKKVNKANNTENNNLVKNLISDFENMSIQAPQNNTHIALRIAIANPGILNAPIANRTKVLTITPDEFKSISKSLF